MSVALLCLPALLLAQQADTNQITPEEFMAKLSPMRRVFGKKESPQAPAPPPTTA
jgi:hypothetical protein